MTRTLRLNSNPLRLLTVPTLCALALSACATKPVEAPAPVEIKLQPVDFCVPMSQVTAVEVPAETQVFYAITMIENPPYEPIERKEKQTRVVKEAYIILVDESGKEVSNTCDKFDGVDPNTGIPLDGGYTDSFPAPVPAE